jgi:hypothetical protein
MENDSARQEKNIYNYQTTSTLYDISFKKSKKCRLAVGTLKKNNNN